MHVPSHPNGLAGFTNLVTRVAAPQEETVSTMSKSSIRRGSMIGSSRKKGKG